MRLAVPIGIVKEVNYHFIGFMPILTAKDSGLLQLIEKYGDLTSIVTCVQPI